MGLFGLDGRGSSLVKPVLGEVCENSHTTNYPCKAQAPRGRGASAEAGLESSTPQFITNDIIFFPIKSRSGRETRAGGRNTSWRGRETNAGGRPRSEEAAGSGFALPHNRAAPRSCGAGARAVRVHWSELVWAKRFQNIRLVLLTPRGTPHYFHLSLTGPGEVGAGRVPWILGRNNFLQTQDRATRKYLCRRPGLWSADSPGGREASCGERAGPAAPSLTPECQASSGRRHLLQEPPTAPAPCAAFSASLLCPHDR